jgi:uncharacterized membrane protein
VLSTRLRTRLFLRSWGHFSDSIWFYPTLISLSALLLFGFTNALDQTNWLHHNQSHLPVWLGDMLDTRDAGTAQFLLQSIASMWATIIGISFSVTLVTVQLTATKYVAQVLPVFERDRVNQIVLGVYLATVGYSLLVLRTVQVQPHQFVPHLGIAVAITLAITSLLLLILFISNIINFVRPGYLLEMTSDEAAAALASETPLGTVRGIETLDALLEPLEARGTGHPILARRKGVVTAVLWEELCACAMVELKRLPPNKHRWALRCYRKVGDRVRAGDVLAELIHPGDKELGKRLNFRVSQAHDIRPFRRHRQDADYGIEVIAGMAVKGVFQGDLDVAFESVDYLFGLLPAVARQERIAEFVQLQANGNEMIIQRPAGDLLGKLMRELTLLSEVAIEHSGFRLLTEGISTRLTTALIIMAEEDEWKPFLRLLNLADSWYQSAFFHLGWVNGMRRLSGDLTGMAKAVHARCHPAASNRILLMLQDLRIRFDEDPQASKALQEAFDALRQELKETPNPA